MGNWIDTFNREYFDAADYYELRNLNMELELVNENLLSFNTELQEEVELWKSRANFAARVIRMLFRLAHV